MSSCFHYIYTKCLEDMTELETDQDLLNKQSTDIAEQTGGAELLLCRPPSLVPVSQV